MNFGPLMLTFLPKILFSMMAPDRSVFIQLPLIYRYFAGGTEEQLGRCTESRKFG